MGVSMRVPMIFGTQYTTLCLISRFKSSNKGENLQTFFNTIFLHMSEL